MILLELIDFRLAKLNFEGEKEMDTAEFNQAVVENAVARMFGLDREVYLRYLAEVSRSAEVSPLDVKDQLDHLIEKLVLKMLHPLKPEELAEMVGSDDSKPEMSVSPKKSGIPGPLFDR